MHAHFSKPINVFDPDEVECGLQFQRKPRPPRQLSDTPLIAAADVGHDRCQRIYKAVGGGPAGHGRTTFSAAHANLNLPN